MARRRDVGVRAVLKCPRCEHEYETTVSAGTGIRPGQVIWQEHFPGMCVGEEVSPSTATALMEDSDD